MHEASALVHQFALPLHKSGGTGGASQAGTGSIAGFPAALRKNKRRVRNTWPDAAGRSNRLQSDD